MAKTPVFDYSRLKGRIIEKFGTLGNFAPVMDWTIVTQQKKMKNRVPWTQRDIMAACEVLEISAEEIPAYFFAEKV
jgi:hypothetical protein